MRPWSADQPPRSGDARPRRLSGMPVPEQDPSLAGRPAPGSMNWGADQPSGAWAGDLPPFSNQAMANRMAPPPGMAKSVSRPMTPGEFPEPAPQARNCSTSRPTGTFRARHRSQPEAALLAGADPALAGASLPTRLALSAIEPNVADTGRATNARCCRPGRQQLHNAGTDQPPGVSDSPVTEERHRASHWSIAFSSNHPTD